MWEPLARAHGVNMIEFTRQLGLTWALVRARMQAFARDHAVERFANHILILPVGQSFQTAPPEFVARLQAALPGKPLICAFAPGEAARASYEAVGLPCTATESVSELVAAIAAASVVLTVDSFASHIAQFGARNHVALMSHDLPAHTVHPFGPGRTVFTPLPCSPCVYLGRQAAGKCAMGHRACLAFSSDDYFADALAAVRRALA
jgi:ADP-heptose:LPS heptosyltransferase